MEHEGFAKFEVVEGSPTAQSISSDRIPDSGSISSAIDSTARNGEFVARRRFQRGSVFKNKTRTLWVGQYSEYLLDSSGVEKRNRKYVVLGSVHDPDTGREMTKREASRLLQPYVDRVNSSISTATRERRSATFEAFSEIWERDYLCLSKPSTQCTVRGQLKRLKAAFGKKDIRQIDAGTLQRVIAAMEAEGLEAKTIRNLWATVRLIWEAALAQKYVDNLLPKPKLPRISKKKPRYYLLQEVASVLAGSETELKAFYWLAAEGGLRSGELSAPKLTDIVADGITVRQSVWHGRIGVPKTSNAIRTVALSSHLSLLLREQSERQRLKGHTFLFTTKSGKPWDANMLVKRKLYPLLDTLGIERKGLHAFRHFNASLLSNLRVPLKVIQERLGHASAGSLTLDVYTHSEWEQNVEAAQLAGEAIQTAVNSVSLTANQKGLPILSESEALVNQ